MARPKKVDTPVNPPVQSNEPAKEAPTLIIEVDSFVRIRDSVSLLLQLLQVFEPSSPHHGPEGRDDARYESARPTTHTLALPVNRTTVSLG